jgi:uncharacterized protein
MKIQVGGLSEGVHRYSFRAPPSELGLAGEFVDEVAVEVVLEKNSNDLLLKAKISTGGRWECDRCVTPFVIPVSGTYQMYYVREGSGTARVDPTEFQYIPSETSVIDIADDVRQTIMLSVPLKRICREDCRGLCPNCGKHLNDGPCNCSTVEIDERWDKLREIRNRTGQNVR